MRKNSTLYVGLGLVALLAALNFIGLKFYLYWPKEGLLGFDSFMHFLGGLTLGTLIIWILGIGERSLGTFLAALGLVVFLGTAWEVFEYVFDIAGVSAGQYWQDTIHDLVLDTLGGVVAYVFLTTSRSRQPS